MIERSLDPRDGIILVRGTGLWTRAELDQHYDDLRRMISRQRAAGVPIRVLVDVIGAERPSPAVERHAREQIDRTYRAGDRVALVVADTGDKAHVRSLTGGTQIATFLSRMAAEMWLMETELKPPR